jgi:hypothetical protein
MINRDLNKLLKGYQCGIDAILYSIVFQPVSQCVCVLFSVAEFLAIHRLQRTMMLPRAVFRQQDDNLFSKSKSNIREISFVRFGEPMMMTHPYHRPVRNFCVHLSRKGQLVPICREIAMHHQLRLDALFNPIAFD